MAPTKSYVFAIQRCDYAHHTDRKGRDKLIEIHASLESANTAAKAHLQKEARKAISGAGETSESETKDGGYEGVCYTSEDRRNHFAVTVKKMELKGGARGDAPQSSASGAKRSAAKATASDAKSAATSDSLKDKKLLFTGTFDSMDRAACETTAKSHGAKIVAPTKLAEADFIVLGTRAGQKKLDEIEAQQLKTITENDFLDMIGQSSNKKQKA
ncbi:hypothetical protein TI39_contig831g00016 [Zymoseptoria brevis]|uniref:BRCT domain-containing protein n=1 Tax=Zymoseptoria brevis TaxID=1047168 RepID=A0A0F4GF98_9PEZI|nr:hypothetical protein TI39_contig831g00016 [Zymoseptoria brevis]